MKRKKSTETRDCTILMIPIMASLPSLLLVFVLPSLPQTLPPSSHSPPYLGPIFLHVNCVKLHVQKLQNVGMAHGLQGRDFGAKLKKRAFDSLTFFQKRRERKM